MEITKDQETLTTKVVETVLHHRLITGIKSPMIKNLSKRKNNGVLQNSIRNKNKKMLRFPDPAIMPKPDDNYLK
jgi:hypothetical protein